MQSIMSRIISANVGKKIFSALIDTSGLANDGHGTVDIHLGAKHKKIYISSAHAKALVTGKPNRNLDNLLRL